MRKLSRDDILSADDRKTETVEVAEWGGSVVIRSWTVAEADKIGKHVSKGMDAGYIENYRETFVAASIIDEDGELMFNGAADLKELAKKSPAALNRVFEAVNKLNRLEAVEDEAGN